MSIGIEEDVAEDEFHYRRVASEASRDGDASQDQPAAPPDPHLQIVDAEVRGPGTDTLLNALGRASEQSVEVAGTPNSQESDAPQSDTRADDDADEGQTCAGGITTVEGRTNPAALKHWLEQEHQAEVSDFQIEEDNLMLVYDDADDPNPVIDLETDETNAKRKYVTINGVRITAVDDAEDLELEHIAVMGQSALNVAMAA